MVSTIFENVLTSVIVRPSLCDGRVMSGTASRSRGLRHMADVIFATRRLGGAPLIVWWQSSVTCLRTACQSRCRELLVNLGDQPFESFRSQRFRTGDEHIL